MAARLARGAECRDQCRGGNRRDRGRGTVATDRSMASQRRLHRSRRRPARRARPGGSQRRRERRSTRHQAQIRSSLNLRHGIELDGWLRYVDRIGATGRGFGVVPAYVTLDAGVGGHRSSTFSSRSSDNICWMTDIRNLPLVRSNGRCTARRPGGSDFGQKKKGGTFSDAAWTAGAVPGELSVTYHRGSERRRLLPPPNPPPPDVFGFASLTVRLRPPSW